MMYSFDKGKALTAICCHVTYDLSLYESFIVNCGVAAEILIRRQMFLKRGHQLINTLRSSMQLKRICLMVKEAARICCAFRHTLQSFNISSVLCYVGKSVAAQDEGGFSSFFIFQHRQSI